MNVKTYSWEEAVQWLREQPNQQDLVRHCYYDDPIEVAAERYLQSEEWQAIRKLLGSRLSGRVLDLGAGRGIASYAFAKEGCMVTALEPDPSPLVGADAIKTLSEHSNIPIKIVEEYGEKLPFSDESFDIVFGRAVLHHALDLKQLCHEVARVLTKGGVFLAIREHVISKKADLDTFLNAHPLHSLYKGENAFLLSDYLYAMKSANLKLQSVIGPFDNVINYAPITEHDFKQMILQKLSLKFSRKLAKVLTSVEFISKAYRRSLSRNSNEPGRLYAFLTVKS